MNGEIAVSSGVAVLAIIGLVVGLVVLLVVIWLLQNTLSPLLRVKADVTQALTAPMLKNGVPGTEQLGTTRRLAESVPDLAVRYLQKLSLPVNTAAPGPVGATPRAARPSAGSLWDSP